MSARRGKKRTFAESHDVSVKSVWSHTNKKRKKRASKRRALPKELEQKMAKATTAYINQKFDEAKLLAKEVWTKKPSYSEVWNLLAKIHEEEGNLEEALTAFMTFVTLRYPAKTIEPEITFKEDSESEHSHSDESDSDLSDDDDDDVDGKKNKRPTAQLIQKIASLAMKTGNYDTALEMIDKMERYYGLMLHRMNESNRRIRARWTVQEMESKKKEIDSFLEHIYRQKVEIYKIRKQFDKVRELYVKRYAVKFRDTHPLLVPLGNKKDDVTGIGIDELHEEVLVILKALGPHQSSKRTYNVLYRYLVIFTANNRFNVDSVRSLKWLKYQMSSNAEYKKTFKRLLTLLIDAAMKLYHFHAALNFLELFNKSLRDSVTFEVTIRGGICSLWIGDESAAMKQYQKLVDEPPQTGLGSLYMLFADALIATNRLEKAQVLMQRIERIVHFDQPRIWMRFGDYYALKKEEDAAIVQYRKVIEAVTKQIELETEKQQTPKSSEGKTLDPKAMQSRWEREDILLSARLKLLEIHFMRHDDEDANALLKDIQRWKEQHVVVDPANLKLQNDDDDDDDDDDDEEEEDGHSLLNDDRNVPSSTTKTTENTTSSVFGKVTAPEKRLKLNAMHRVYFKTGLFGSVTVPRSLIHLNLLHIELRWHYDEYVRLFRDDRYLEYLEKCESKIIELIQICHEALRTETKTRIVVFNERKYKYFGMTLSAAEEQEQNGCKLVSRALNIGRGGLLRGVRDVTPNSRITSINGVDCNVLKFRSILEALESAAVPTTIVFEAQQNVYPLLRENRGRSHPLLYSVHHLHQILKDRCVLELVVLLCKIWYECDATAEQRENGQYVVDEEEIERRKRTQTEVMVAIVDDAGSYLDLNKLEFDHFLMAELHLLMANVYFNANDFERCYSELVRVLNLQPNNINAMRHLYTMYRALRHNPKIERTIQRQLTKKREDSKNGQFVWHEMILGHSAFSKSSYGIAARFYARILRIDRKSPFVHLMMGITYLHHCLNRNVGGNEAVRGKKFLIAIQAIAFIKCYVKLSGTSPESVYNFARALHFLGLYAPAEQLYRQIILRITTGYTTRARNTRNNAVLRYAAFNLSRIYVVSGQTEIASETLKQNIIV